MGFAHLHLHAQQSVLDGYGKVEDYVARAVQLKQLFLACTEHGNLCSAPLLYWECRRVGIDPVLGMEGYYIPDLREKEQAERHHVVFLARGEKGYRTLCQLSTEAHRNFYRKPLLDRRILSSLGSDAKNLTVLSGCASSRISRMIMEDREDDALEEAKWWKSVFPHFYLELQNHNTEFDPKIIKGTLSLARRTHTPFVITADSHYVLKEDAPFHDSLLCIQTASDIDDPNRMRFPGSGYHLRSAKEISRAFAKYGAVEKIGRRNTLKIAKDCIGKIPEWESRSWLVPKFSENSNALLRKLVREGLKEKGLSKNSAYKKRAIEELRIIEQTGIADFLLITRDVVLWAKKQGIPVGPARGSFAAALCGFLIGAHGVDSVRYDLMFERFLNPARPRMPDIDTDIGRDRRQEVFDYIVDKYGRENVMNIAAFQTMKTRSAFQSLAKAYGISYPEALAISKTLSDDDEHIPSEITNRYPDLADQLIHLTGIIRSVSTHPAGIIIADPSTKIRSLVPEMWIASTKKWVSQYDQEAISRMGLLKQDWLGLRSLETIRECVELIAATTGQVVHPEKWIPDEEDGDEKVYQLLQEGKTAGIFQLEGSANTRGIQDIHPTQFEDLVASSALYRAPTIIAGFPKRYLENRRKKSVRYAHPDLKPILSKTHGCFAYETPIVTKTGVRQIGELAGESHSLMTRRGKWVESEIRSFGVQPLMKLVLKRNKQRRVVYTTPEHRWFAKWHDKSSEFTEKVTTELKVGMVLQSQIAYRGGKHSTPSPFGIAHGVVFGDGHATPYQSRVELHGKKNAELLRFFSASRISEPYGEDRYSEPCVMVHDLPRSWKQPPSSDEGASYLLGWMAGYFAADGCVDKKGQAKLFSVSRENLAVFRTFGHLVGITTYDITERLIKNNFLPNGKDAGDQTVFEIGLMSSTVDSEFFILSHHRERFDMAQANRIRKNRAQWKVVAVEETNRVEEVYCAVVPDMAAFVLEGNILTGNSLIYQEQAMLIGRVLAGFSMEEEDDLKDAIGKKKPKQMDELRPKFIKGCVGRGVLKDVAAKIWDEMIASGSSYLFNRAHSCSYSLLTYQTARLKAFWPYQFLAALIRTTTDKDKRKSYLQEARDEGLRILPPDVNKSDRKVTLILRKNVLLFGLEDITGIGPKQAEKILAGRPEEGYRSINEVWDAAKNEGVMQALADAGALACLGEPIKMDKAEKTLDWQFIDRMEKVRKRFAHKVVLPNGRNGNVKVIGEILSIDKRRTKKGDPYLTWKIRWSPSEIYTVRLWSGSEPVWKLKVGAIVSVRGKYEERWQNVSVTDPDQVRVLRRERAKK